MLQVNLALCDLLQFYSVQFLAVKLMLKVQSIKDVLLVFYSMRPPPGKALGKWAMHYSLTSEMHLNLIRLLSHMTSSLSPTTLSIISKEKLWFTCPCPLFPAFFHLIMLWSHLCAHRNRSSSGFFNLPPPPPLRTSCAISSPCSVSTRHDGAWTLQDFGAADCTCCT